MAEMWMDHWRQKLIESNILEYQDIKDELNWIDRHSAQEKAGERAGLIAAMEHGLSWMFSQTKPHTGPLSPGCLLCGQGSWSCLFINGKCNCRCFYCPTSQDDLSVPTTNRLTFERAEDYSDYVREFGFTGVSISGGEPLLTLDRTLDYIRTVRQKNGDGLHIWMYTNGTLLDQDTVLKLKDAGLSEIRFDLGARDYRLDALRLAVGHIPVVTVEVPAVPEDRDTLASLIPVLHDEGVNHLNLHQLRLTPHNSRFLKKRNYTLLHGERVTVLESELTVLYLLNRAVLEGFRLPVNYCAFAYKNQHQRAANRKRNAPFIMKPYESLTENGFIRSLSLKGEAHAMQRNTEQLMAADSGRTLWQQPGPDRILFHPSLLGHLDLTACQVCVSYSEAMVSPALSYFNPFKEIRLGSGKKIYVEKQSRKKDIVIDREALTLFHQALTDQATRTVPPECLEYERIRPGLTDYF